jgi:hypothetical protein
MSKYNNDRGLDGMSPLSYMGVKPSTPPQLVQELRPPTQQDYVGYTVGTIWLVKGTEQVWMLVDKSAHLANWTLTTSGDLRFLADDGNEAQPLFGVVHVQGGPNIDTSAVPNLDHNLIVGLHDSLVVPGTVQLTSLPSGVVKTDATGLFSASNGADGQVLVGGGAVPEWFTITSNDASIVFTPGPNTLDMVAVGGGGGGFAGLIGDDAATATPDIAHKVTVAGGVGIATTAVPGTLTVGIGESAVDGEILIGRGAGNPSVWGVLESADASIVITPTATGINLAGVAGGAGFGGIIDDAAATAIPDGASKITVLGGARATASVDTCTLSSIKTGASEITVALDYPTGGGGGADDGKVLISSDAGAPLWARITAGAGITVTPNHNQITITNTGGGGGGGGVTILDCINGTATPNPVTPTTLYVEGDENVLSGGYSNITTVARVVAGINDTVEIVLKPAIAIPATTAWNAGILYLGGMAVAGGANRFLHAYGTYNTFLGRNSGNLTLTTANSRYNTAVGYNTLLSLTGTAALLGAQNTAIGYSVLDSCSDGSYNTGVGTSCLTTLTTGSGNTAVGVGALRDTTISTFNTALGYNACSNITTGPENVAIGYGSLYTATTSTQNVAIGNQALYLQVGGLNTGYNVAIGHSAGYNLTGASNVIVGKDALKAGTVVSSTVAVGAGALQLGTNPSYSVAVGCSAMGGGITIGDYNTAIGYTSLFKVTSGNNNISIGGTTDIAGGHSTLGLATTAARNIAIGNEALSHLVNGNSNICIGYLAGSSYTGGENNNIAINNIGTVGENNTTTIGNLATTATYITGVYNSALGAVRHVVGADSAGKIGKYVGVGSTYMSVYATAPEVNVTGSGEKFYLGAGSAFALEVNDGGGALDLGGGHALVYTFPISGSYLITMNIRISGLRAPFVLPPPPPPARIVDPVVIECTGGMYSYFPSLSYNGYAPFESVSFAVVAKQNAGDTMKAFLQFSYSPGESVGGTWPLTYNIQSKTLGYDAFDATNFRFTQISATLLSVA